MDLNEELKILFQMREKDMISDEEYHLHKKSIEQEKEEIRKKILERCGIETNRIVGSADEKTPVFLQKVFSTKKGEKPIGDDSKILDKNWWEE